MRTIVGVVGDTKFERVTDEGKTALYIPLAQAAPAAMRVVVRTSGDPAVALAEIRTVVRAIDADTPVDQLRTMDQLIDRAVEGSRFAASMMMVFALAGLGLGAIGIYGTVADQVGQRRREIGVRLALGARRTDVYRTVLGNTLLVVATGALAGIGGALMTMKLFESMLFGVAPSDPAAFALAVAVLAVTALAAGFVPARRASSLDPLTILKTD
jgi:ABC-type antimicrobial peptide transport system permease subunit